MGFGFAVAVFAIACIGLVHNHVYVDLGGRRIIKKKKKRAIRLGSSDTSGGRWSQVRQLLVMNRYSESL